MKIDYEKKPNYLLLFKEYESFTKKNKKTIYDVCLEIASEHELMSESRKDRLRELGYQNSVVIPLYPPEYKKDLGKGSSSSSEADIAFKDRSYAISKLDELNIIESCINDKVFLKYGIEDDFWVITLNLRFFKRFIGQIEKKQENDASSVDDEKTVKSVHPKAPKKAKKLVKGYVLGINEIGKKFQILINDKVFDRHNKSSPSYYVYKLLVEDMGITKSLQEMCNAVTDGMHSTSDLEFRPKDLSTFLGKLGFRKDIKNAFFETKDKETIMLRKYVTKKEFEDSKIPPLKDVDGRLIKPIDISHLINKPIRRKPLKNF